MGILLFFIWVVVTWNIYLGEKTSSNVYLSSVHFTLCKLYCICSGTVRAESWTFRTYLCDPHCVQSDHHPGSRGEVMLLFWRKPHLVTSLPYPSVGISRKGARERENACSVHFWGSCSTAQQHQMPVDGRKHRRLAQYPACPSTVE